MRQHESRRFTTLVRGSSRPNHSPGWEVREIPQSSIIFKTMELSISHDIQGLWVYLFFSMVFQRSSMLDSPAVPGFETVKSHIDPLIHLQRVRLRGYLLRVPEVYCTIPLFFIYLSSPSNHLDRLCSVLGPLGGGKERLHGRPFVNWRDPGDWPVGRSH